MTITVINERGEYVIWCKACRRSHRLPTPMVYPMTHDEVLIRERVAAEMNEVR